MTTSPYPAASLSRPAVRDYFLRHLAAVPAGEGEGLAPVPDTAVLESLINTVFWASLRREEGFVPKMSLAYRAAGRQRLLDALRAADAADAARAGQGGAGRRARRHPPGVWAKTAS